MNRSHGLEHIQESIWPGLGPLSAIISHVLAGLAMALPLGLSFSSWSRIPPGPCLSLFVVFLRGAGSAPHAVRLRPPPSSIEVGVGDIKKSCLTGIYG